jgi:acyl carrier protein
MQIVSHVDTATRMGFGQHCTQTEAALMKIWNSLFGIDDVSSDDNFIDLGGESILGMQCVYLVREAFGVDLELTALFVDTANLGELARMIDELRTRV